MLVLGVKKRLTKKLKHFRTLFLVQDKLAVSLIIGSRPKALAASLSSIDRESVYLLSDISKPCLFQGIDCFLVSKKLLSDSPFKPIILKRFMDDICFCVDT